MSLRSSRRVDRCDNVIFSKLYYYVTLPQESGLASREGDSCLVVLELLKLHWVPSMEPGPREFNENPCIRFMSPETEIPARHRLGYNPRRLRTCAIFDH